MNLQILNFSRAHLNEIASVQQRPAFRKSTRNMALATVALEKALSSLQGVFEKNRARVGLILVSASGELETTVDFLKTLNEMKLARPLLFQNSLHNATAGFLSIQFGITGPVLTVCASASGNEQALESAEALLVGKQCDLCLVLSVEVWPHFKGYEVPAEIEVDGAACLLLSTCEFARDENLTSHTTLTDIQRKPLKSSQKDELWSPIPLAENAIYQLVTRLEKNKKGQLEISSPSFGSSMIQWQDAL